MKGILWAVPVDGLGTMDKYKLFPIVPHPHVTIAFGVDRDHVEQWIGYEFTGTVTGHAIGESAHCLLVRLPSKIPFTGTFPHITLSHSPDVLPIAAKEMIRTGNCNLVQWDPMLPIAFRLEFLEWV